MVRHRSEPYNHCGDMVVVTAQWDVQDGGGGLGCLVLLSHLDNRGLEGVLDVIGERPYQCRCRSCLGRVSTTAWCLYALYSVGRKSSGKERKFKIGRLA
jgi:hypothetical protein